MDLSHHGWITCLDAVYNGDILISGHIDGMINIFKGSFSSIKDLNIRLILSI